MAEAPAPLSVSALTYRIKQSLESGFTSLRVEGELSNCKFATSGHFYFVLKDDRAQIAGVMWRSKVDGLAIAPADGMKVLVAGRLTVYEVRGVYQLDASSIRPLGVGELQAAFERLKSKLEAEGLFGEGRKKPIPGFPERIGIVTSPTGAALQDMLRAIRGRYPAVEVVLAPVRVQGAGAAEEIAEAIAQLNRLGGVEVLIVARGGGSLEDLWAFNEETVARAIAASKVPVISGVGHEVDVTIADLVADIRATTPTQAALLALPDRAALLENLRELCYTMRENAGTLLRSHRRDIATILKSYAFNRPVDLLRQFTQRRDDLSRTLVTSVTHDLALRKSRLTALRQRLDALGPDHVLRRGYAIVRKQGTAVQSRAALRPGDAIETTFHDGAVRSTVDRKP
jgi:exodeoxyribonuclease VII large subunit